MLSQGVALWFIYRVKLDHFFMSCFTHGHIAILPSLHTEITSVLDQGVNFDLVHYVEHSHI